jgi:dihydrodipicolinate synthase/N-acetylneuraminate lyase
MVEPPSVVPTSTDAEHIDRFERIASSSPVPVMLYNNPRRTQIRLKPAMLATLAKHPNIVALKNARRDFCDLTTKMELAGKALNIFVGPAALNALGRPAGLSRLPVHPLEPKERDLLQSLRSTRWYSPGTTRSGPPAALPAL